MLLQMALFHSFKWLSNIPFYICTTSCLSMHLLMDLGCLYILTVVNSAAMNTGVHVSNLNFEIHLKAFWFSSSSLPTLIISKLKCWGFLSHCSLWPPSNHSSPKLFLKNISNHVTSLFRQLNESPYEKRIQLACQILLHQSTAHLPKLLHYPWLPSIQ